jgi:16S rRNA (guanine966-N2)-methyltransferase
MRIVAGSAKGRVLAAPKSDDVIRPTADRVRETLFNILGQRCDGLTVLDLFAGTGALGLEAVSRGADSAVLIDRHRESLGLCRQNAAALGMTAQVEIISTDAIEGIALLGRQNRTFQLVFVDPPYQFQMGLPVLNGLAAASIVSVGGVVVLEAGLREVFPEAVGPFRRIEQRTLGITRLSIFRLTEAAS